MHAWLRLADLNLAESLREFTRWSHEAEIHERDQVLITAGADAFPGINDVMRCGSFAQPPAQALVARAQAFFAGKNRGFGLRARAHLDADLIALCQARKLYLIADAPGMLIERPIDRTRLPARAAAHELRVAADVDTARDFARVCAESYATMGLPAASAQALFAHVEFALQPHIHIVVAYDGTRPVSAAMSLLSHGIAGVYWVATIPSARGHGIAAHCTAAVTEACFERGARAVTLQASRQGEPIYRALGFRELTRYPWYLCPAPGTR